MKPLKRTRYYTMNSWNRSESLAYNLKIYNVANNELQNKLYELIDTEDFYDEINFLIIDFNEQHNFEWQAGFNGRSGGYLVLYKGGLNKDGSYYAKPGLNIEDDDVPTEIKKDFRKLAINIVKYAENTAKNYNAVVKEIEFTKEVKVLEKIAS